MGADYWISFSCGDDKHINEGTKIAECARAFPGIPHKYPHLKMIGVNYQTGIYSQSDPGISDRYRSAHCGIPKQRRRI